MLKVLVIINVDPQSDTFKVIKFWKTFLDGKFCVVIILLVFSDHVNLIVATRHQPDDL